MGEGAVKGQRFRDSLAAAFGRRIAGLGSLALVVVVVGLIGRVVLG